VIHLGHEFQEMAATRAAELTVAYKTLSDPVLREQYDASMAGFESAPVVTVDAPPAAPAPDVVEPDAPQAEAPGPQAPPARGRFESERAGRDQILRRAIAERVRGAVEALFGKVETPSIRGFDAAYVPVAKPRFLGKHPPRVLVRVGEVVDGAVLAEAWLAAARAGVHAGKSPVIALVFGGRLASRQDLLKGIEMAARQRKGPDAPEEIVVVPVAIADWGCVLPNVVTGPVRKLVDMICG
jgi:hypothetical protein